MFPPARDSVIETIDHDGWTLEQRVAGLGVVGFVFEGRPNVFADACGVLRSGNTVVFRIGSDALGTARAIVEFALDPALEEAGLPAGSASPGRQLGPRRRLGHVQRPTTLVGRGPRQRPGRGSARSGRSPGRNLGQPSRHRGSVGHRRQRLRRVIDWRRWSTAHSTVRSATTANTICIPTAEASPVGSSGA